MPFNFLLAHQVHHGTSFNENGVKVSINRVSGESIVFFHLDSDNSSRLRKFLDIGDTGIICDLLIYYFKDGGTKPKLFLVELKGRDISHAVEQIGNVYRALQIKLNAKNLTKNFIWGAFIKTNSNSSVPRNNKHLLKSLADKGLICKTIKKDEEIFIRNLEEK